MGELPDSRQFGSNPAFQISIGAKSPIHSLTMESDPHVRIVSLSDKCSAFQRSMSAMAIMRESTSIAGDIGVYQGLI
jgi:hypothetical protein